MRALKLAVAAVLPAALVAARFAWPSTPKDDLWGFFAVVGFFATLLGCSSATLILRARAVRLPTWVIALIGVAVAAMLLAVFATMPSWPFTGVGFIVAWILIACGFTGALLYVAGYRYA